MSLSLSISIPCNTKKNKETRTQISRHLLLTVAGDDDLVGRPVDAFVFVTRQLSARRQNFATELAGPASARVDAQVGVQRRLVRERLRAELALERPLAL